MNVQSASRVLLTRLVIAVGAVLGVCAPLVLVAPAPAGALERVSASGPGDFEAPGLAPQGWTVQAQAPSSAQVTSTVAISGTRALRVLDSSTTAGVVVARPKFALLPGRQYNVQGYAYTTSGTQLLSLQFYDGTGRSVGRTNVSTTGATMVWSRVDTTAVAPSTARSASILISSSSASTSQVYWDAVTIIAPSVPNGGFESAPSTASPVPSWTRATGTGIAASEVTPGRVGTRSLMLKDASTRLAATATSAPTPVYPGVSHDVRAWVQSDASSVTMLVQWFTSSGALAGSTPVPTPTAPRAWTSVLGRVTAPNTAATARIVVSTSVPSTSVGRVDDVRMTPTIGSSVTAWSSGSAGEPLDSFSNSTTLGMATIGGRATVYSIVAGDPGELQFADVQTGAVVRRVPLAGLTVGWGLVQAPSGLIYAAGTGGHLYEINPAGGGARDVGKPAPGATMIWDLATDDAGRVLAATYPDSHLAVYDPATGASTDLGSVSTAHDYARSVAVVGTNAYVGLGSTDPCIMRISLSNPADRERILLPVPVTAGRVTSIQALGRFLSVQTPGGVTAAGATYTGERRLYDLHNRTWDVPANLNTQTPSGLDSTGRFFYLSYQQLWSVDSATGTKSSLFRTSTPMGRDRLVFDGALDGTSREWVVSYDPSGVVAAVDPRTQAQLTYTVRFAPTKMKVKTVDEGPTGSMYVGGFGGSSLSIVASGTGASTQYPATPSSAANAIGELEGSHAHGGFQYLGTYNDAKIFRYDPTKPWVDGTNPRLLANVGTTLQQDRPQAWASSGTRTYFGTVPRYGVLGGALGVIPDDASSPWVIPSPVKDQGIVSLAASGNVVYGGTTRWGGLGATPSQPTAAVFAYDVVQRKVLWTVKPIGGAQAFGGLVLGPSGSLWAASGTRLVELDARTGATRRQLMVYPEQVQNVATFKNADLVYSGGLLYLAAGKVYAVDPLTLRVSTPVSAGLTSRQLAVVGTRIYYAAGTTLRWFAPTG